MACEEILPIHPKMEMMLCLGHHDSLHLTPLGSTIHSPSHSLSESVPPGRNSLSCRAAIVRALDGPGPACAFPSAPRTVPNQ